MRSPTQPLATPVATTTQATPVSLLALDPQNARNLRERRLLGVAYLNAAESEKSTLARSIGDDLADVVHPGLEGRGIAGRLRIDQRRGRAQRVDGHALDLGRLLAQELRRQTVAR